MPGRLLIRADADERIGLGHVVRMLALARAWTASGGEAAFAKRRGPAGIDRQIAGANVASFLIDGDAGTGADAEQTARAASELAADWLVFDGYAFGPDYLDRLAGAAPRRMVLDDHGYADRFRVEALLNQNAGATAERYAESAPGVRLLLGPHYALLRPEFAANRRIDREPPPVARRIVVAMGGADPLGLTGRVLEALARPEAPRVEAVCLVGPANPRAGSLAARAEASGGAVRVIVDAADPAAVMAEADLAVSAAGSTCYEWACLGVPVLAIVAADNQAGIAAGLERAGAIESLGAAESASPERIAARLAALAANAERRRRMSARGRDLVDGRGAARVAAALSAMAEE